MMKPKIIFWKEYIKTAESRIREVIDNMTIAERFKIVPNWIILERSLSDTYKRIERFEKNLPWDGSEAVSIEIKMTRINSDVEKIIGKIK